MSPNHYPVFSLSQYDTAEQIKVKISLLIQLYLKDPDVSIAEAVAKHFSAMLAYPEYIDDIELRCRFRQLEMHWRCLAWIGDSPIVPPKPRELQADVKSLSLRQYQEMC